MKKCDIKITRGKNSYLKSVAFKYDLKAKEYVLNNINLEIEPGETVGIIGEQVVPNFISTIDS